jgi:hypothetical protein
VPTIWGAIFQALLGALIAVFLGKCCEWKIHRYCVVSVIDIGVLYVITHIRF